MVYTLNTSQSSKVIHIKSSDIPASQRLFSNTAFVVELQNTITCLENEYLLISLYSASIPMSFYNITEEETSLVINGTTYNISQGNYNITNLQVTVSNLVNGVLGINTISFTYDKITNKTTMIVPGTSASILQFGDGLAKSLGFNTGIIYDLIVGANYTAQNVANIIDKYSIYLRTDLNISNAYNTLGQLSDILERIPIKSANSVLYYEASPSQHKSIIIPKFIKNFKMSLTYDTENDFIDLNGCDFEISLKIDTVKELSRAESIPDVRTKMIIPTIQEPPVESPIDTTEQES
jgi:hypothetical protein